MIHGVTVMETLYIDLHEFGLLMIRDALARVSPCGFGFMLVRGQCSHFGKCRE